MQYFAISVMMLYSTVRHIKAAPSVYVRYIIYSYELAIKCRPLYLIEDERKQYIYVNNIIIRRNDNNSVNNKV